MMPLKRLWTAAFVLMFAFVGVMSLAQDDTTPAPQFELPITRDVTYVVQPRDTLDSIGAFFDVSIDCLRTTNDLSPLDILRPETELVVSVDCPPYTGANIVAVPRTDAREVTDGRYFVKRNDTLDTIGQALNISVEVLAQANNITEPSRLAIGQELVIPEDAPPYGVVPPARVLGQDPAATPQPGTGSQGGDDDTYVVQPNDTLDTIGQALDVSVVALATANGIEYGTRFILKPGDVLTVPADAPPYGEFASLGEPAGATIASGEVYVIQPGDTIDTIGQRLNVDRQCIIDANQIALPRAIRPGQVIGVPSNCPPYSAFSAPAATPTPAAP